MRIISCNNLQDIRKIMRDINVDRYGIDIMAPKAVSRVIKISNLSNIQANILKQEMLSLGGDIAVSRGALTGKAKKTDCVLMGNISQIINLCRKLKNQPFGLSRVALEIKQVLNNYQKDNFVINLYGHRLNLGRRTHIMGIINLTPDSFSGDGLYKAKSAKRKAQNYIENYVEKIVKDGADIIDIGGESSRPGARPVSVKEEKNRIIPVIKKLVKKIKAPISVDTSKPEVAKAALGYGASIINDITGLKNPKMPKVISKYKAGVVIMHMKGSPHTMQRNPEYKSVVDEIIDFLGVSIRAALDAGIARDKIIIDPGIGFGKALEHNLEILKYLREFKSLGYPLLVGTSRKSFIGAVTGKAVQERLSGSIASCVLAAAFGANIIRVHDVKEIRDAIKVIDGILQVSR